MTMAQSQPGHGLGSGFLSLRAKWGWIVALGVVYMLAGLWALQSVLLATVASVYVVGLMMGVAGIAEIINGFQMKTWGRFLLWIALGLLYVVAGVLTFENPLLAASLLTLMLGFALIVSGIMRIVLALGMGQGTPWLWVVLSGVITLVLGGVIIAHWPFSSLYVLGIFLGVDLVFAGASYVSIGMALRGARTA